MDVTEVGASFDGHFGCGAMTKLDVALKRAERLLGLPFLLRNEHQTGHILILETKSGRDT